MSITRRFTPILFVFFFISAHAQIAKQAPDPERFTKKELRKIAHSQILYQKGKYDKAIALIKAPLSTHLQNEQLWSLDVEYEFTRYTKQVQLESLFGLAGMSRSLKSEQYRVSLIDACAKATLYCRAQESAAITLRGLLVDPPIDTGVSKAAREEFSKGEDAFFQQKYESAERHYKYAVEEDSTYYKATLYVGDAYYNDKEYEASIPWFKKAISMQPSLIEARKYLTDAYTKLHRYEEAYDACVDAILVYPDVGMFIKLNAICDEMDKKFDQHWLCRFNMPNEMNVVQPPVANAPWSFYREAKTKIADYCDANGVITKPNSLTEQKYLEVYSWEYMLKNSNADEFAFASEMKEKGYLDCYVLVSLFHISVYPQYKEFAKTNADRIRKYISTYLVK